MLDWFQPVHPAHHSSGRQLVAQFREAIHQPARGGTINQRWRAIRIEPQHGDGDSETGAKHSHIIVQRDGKWSLTDNWRTQEQLGEKGVVRILLRAPLHSNEVTRLQWHVTTRLIRCLRQMCGIPGAGIFLNDTLALPSGSSASSSAGRGD